MNFKWFLAVTLTGALLVGVVPVWAGHGLGTSDLPVYVTSQRFEHGVMYYRSDTGYIWVFYDDGTLEAFPSYRYGELPDNPIFNVPSNYIRPINGFGRIWGNCSWVRNKLGYATRYELGFQSRVVTRSQAVYLFAYDQTIIEISPYSTWRLVNALPDLPSDLDPAVETVYVKQNPVEAGSTMTVVWSARGTDIVLIEVYNAAGEMIAFFDYLPLAGEVYIAVPIAETGSLRIVAWAANLPDFYVPVTLYERVVSAETTVALIPDMPEKVYTQAAYQAYEHGFMIWRADTGAVIVFVGKQGGQVYSFRDESYGTLPDNPYTVPPVGLVAPIRGFGKVWGNHGFIRDQLGWATGPEAAYDLTIDSYGTETVYLLPEGREALVTWQNFWSLK